MAQTNTKDHDFDPQVILRQIQTQSAECDRLALERDEAKAAANDAQAAYESAVEQLRKLSRKPDMPLFGDDVNDWRNAPLTELHLSDALTQKIIDVAGDTMGKLSEWLNSGGQFCNIKGVGELVAEKIDAALDAFWKAHPEIKRDDPTANDES